MKNLFLVVMFVLSFVACSDDDDDWSEKDLVGKWSIYEFVENGETEEADLETQLSYLEFKSDNSYETYDYYSNRAVKGVYALNGDAIAVELDGATEHATIIELGKNKAVVEMEEDGEKFIAHLQRTTNEQQLFLEPVLDFGATKEQVKAKERREFSKKTTDGLTFMGSNRIEDSSAYIFANGKMTSAAVLLDLYRTDAKELESYMSRKYKKQGQSGDIFYWKKDENILVGVAVKSYGIMVMYAQAE